ncbi:EamA family transporter [Roseiarcaceae bacterium H3SJ34-1]|uniref:EamA family transporter n=1 Tax=Terripilifer ovatus TaxID=3032367 RepID=UPI003AB95473|nr:EamA family transporter [Roseiarcaceae bacterium H3SJ34-1]
MLGGFLALLSAAAFALNNAAARRGVLSGSVLQAMAISVPFGVPFFLVGLLIFGSFDDLWSFSLRDTGWLAAAGVVHFIVGRYANYRATKAIGVNLTGPVQDVNILLSIVLAVVLLGETLTPLMMIGIALVALGPVFTWEGRKAAPEKGAFVPRKLAFTPAYGEGFFYAAVSAVAYGSSPILVRYGLESGGLRNSLGRGVAAGLISYAAATAVIVVMLACPGSLLHVLGTRRREFSWFMVAGLFVGIAQMLRYMALALVPVSIVAPMMRLTSIFRIYFSWLLNREYEAFNNGVFVGTIVSLIGAVILTVNVDFVQSLLPQSEWLSTLLKWRWP